MSTAGDTELVLRVFSKQLTQAALAVSLSVVMAKFPICAVP